MTSSPADTSSPESTVEALGRPRILFYVQDSWGLGHIQRVSRLARALQDTADCLILCGHKEAGWIVPEKCEYVRLPSLNTPLSRGSEGVFWGRRSFLQLSRHQAVRFRRMLFEATIAGFSPDVIVIENRPLGMMDELYEILRETEAVKIFLTRGIMTHPERVRMHYLNPEQEQALGTDLFQKVIVAADRKVWDMASEYCLNSTIAAKLEYVGYMSEPVAASEIQHARAERGLDAGARWIVCSAGGGALGEELVQELLRISDTLPDAVIDVVQGPHSALPWPALLTSTMQRGRIRVHRECRTLPLLHAAADLVVCPGGYNSLVEVMEGGAPIITVSVQPDADGEQYLLASRLAAHYPMVIIDEYHQLNKSIADVLDRHKGRFPIRETGGLNFNGLHNARDLILSCVKRRPVGRDVAQFPSEF